MVIPARDLIPPDNKSVIPAQSLHQNPAAVYLARLASGSRPTMRGSLDSMARLASDGVIETSLEFPWERLRYQHTSAIRSRLAETYAPATANKMLAALRGVLRECWRLGLVTVEEYQRAADLGAVRGKAIPKGRALSRSEVKRLRDACDSDPRPAGRRDAAMLAILVGAGLRRSEVVGLDLGDYDPESAEIRVRAGKGQKDRTTYVADTETVMRWIEVRGSWDGPLFPPINKAGRIGRGRMSAQSVLDILNRRAAQAGVAAFAPHDLRRTFISELLDAGADISTVQALAGHSSVQTTARYDRRGERAKRRAVELLRQ